MSNLTLHAELRFYVNHYRNMSGCNLFRTVASRNCVLYNSGAFLCRTNVFQNEQTCGYAKKVAAKGKGKGMVKEEMKGPEVCKDPVRLTTYAVGVNILKQGEDPQLKPPEQYPEWLFQINLGPPKKLKDLEPDTWEYWQRLRKENILRHNRLHKGRKF